MNKDLNIIVKELCSLLDCQHKVTKVYSEIDHTPVPENVIDGLVKYGDTTISNLICLVRIERLYDLKIIDENEKEKLIEAYNEYKRLESIIASKKFGKFLGKEESDEEYDPRMDELFTLIREKLVTLGIIENFNYEQAFINEIDAKLKTRYIKR